MFMEVLQTLKFSLKKDRQSISFTGGEKVEMREPRTRKLPNQDLLSHLITGDRQAATEALLDSFLDEDF
jgi:hypothetical protein